MRKIEDGRPSKVTRAKGLQLLHCVWECFVRWEKMGRERKREECAPAACFLLLSLCSVIYPLLLASAFPNRLFCTRRKHSNTWTAIRGETNFNTMFWPILRMVAIFTHKKRRKMSVCALRIFSFLHYCNNCGCHGAVTEMEPLWEELFRTSAISWFL